MRIALVCLLVSCAQATEEEIAQPEFWEEEAAIESNAVWTSTRNWTLDDERAYGEWIATIPEDYLAGTGMLVDCADAAMLFRWIYAHDHALPAANTAGGALVGNWNGSWASKPKHEDWRQDQR